MAMNGHDDLEARRMSRLQWPWGRPILLTLTLISGRQLQQECWEYSINLDRRTDAITGTNWTYAGPWPALKAVRNDQIAAVQEARGPIRWRGWRAK